MNAPGQIVPVFKDGAPGIYECTAKLIEKIRDGDGREQWHVRRVDDGAYRTAWISTK